MHHPFSPIVSHLHLGADVGLRDGMVTAQAYSDDARAEYDSVRSRIALSDLNYYSRIRVSGAGALDLLNHVMLADLARLPINQAQNTILLNDDGSPCAEAYVLNLGENYYVLSEGVAPAALFARLASLADARFPGVFLNDLAEHTGLLAIDGPYAWELLKSFLGIGVIGMRYLEVLPDQMLGGIAFTLCRAGKTGEYGYFLLTAAANVTRLWDQLMELGARFDMRPLGYRTLDLCKLENRFSNAHQEVAYTDNVLALNTRVMVSRDKGDYAGAAQIEAMLAGATPARVIGVAFASGADAHGGGLRLGDAVYCGAERIGTLCSLGYSYQQERLIGLALADAAYAYVGLEYTIGARPARTVSAPFIFNRSLQIRPQEDSYFSQAG